MSLKEKIIVFGGVSALWIIGIVQLLFYWHTAY